MTAAMLVPPYATSGWDCLTTSTRESHLGEECRKFICETYFTSKGNFLISNDTLGLGNGEAVLAAELGLGLNRAPERDTSCQPGPRVLGFRTPCFGMEWGSHSLSGRSTPLSRQSLPLSQGPFPYRLGWSSGAYRQHGVFLHSTCTRTPRVRPRKTCFWPLWCLQLTGNRVITQTPDSQTTEQL